MTYHATASDRETLSGIVENGSAIGIANAICCPWTWNANVNATLSVIGNESGTHRDRVSVNENVILICCYPEICCERLKTNYIKIKFVVMRY